MSDDLTDEELGLLKAFKRGPGYLYISPKHGVGENFALTVFQGLHDKQLIHPEASFTPSWWHIQEKGKVMLRQIEAKEKEMCDG